MRAALEAALQEEIGQPVQEVLYVQRIQERSRVLRVGREFHAATMTLRAPSRERIAAIRERLLEFYDAAHRDLPWRRDADAYRIWVAEIMLQQTRVDAVIPYYERWLTRFPTLQHLADADPDSVLRLWEGLGYYSRAHNLHRAARNVMERHDGHVPTTFDELRALPGIGEYTAGAIASIAFGVAEPAVDGNAHRVFARLLDAEDPSPAELRRVAKRIVDPARPGAFNQAVMDLGSSICTPRSPSCLRCPLRDLCRARRRGTVHLRPRPKRPKPVPSFDIATAVIVARDGRALLARRPDHGLLAGLWEFPGVATRDRESPRTAARKLARTLLGTPGGRSIPLGAVDHLFSHRRETYHVFRFSNVSAGSGTALRTEWVRPDQLGDYALPVAQRRIARLLMEG